MKKINKILYLSFDGLADQVSFSQVIPYIKTLNNFFKVYVMTLEKKNNLTDVDLQKINLKKKNINFFFLYFTKRKFFRPIHLFYDFIKTFVYLLFILKKNKIKIIHARGHMPAFVCYFISFIYDLNFVFDFRGLWAEERIDNGSIKLNSFFGILIYKFLKFLEIKTINKSYAIIVLTSKFKKTLIKDQIFHNKKIFVMPCYVEIKKFDLIIKKNKLNIFNELKIPKNSKIITYLGSISGIYLIDQMLLYFNNICNLNKNFYLLIITKQEEIAFKKIKNLALDSIKKNIIVKTLNHIDVPIYLSKSDISMFFLKNSDARKAGCPIKFTESVSLGVPVICNKNIGDLDDYFDESEIGLSIDIKSINDLKLLSENLNFLTKLSRKKIRNYANKKFSIKNAYDQYKLIYKEFI